MKKSEIAQAFSGGKFEKCFDYLTDQTIWNTPGEQYLKGKDEIIPFCKKVTAYFESVTTDFKPLHLIEGDCCVAINGTAEFIREGKYVSIVSSCDVYEFTDQNEIVSIYSYCITEKSEKD
ncbi:MAG: hypothetical protein K0R51_1119 [Cytophagaceae bacterium]|jgi:hypothetical protein|nr:hypothetical protein [Cytophagaceae bacterium]